MTSVLPSDIRNLPTYLVPQQLFICSIVIMMLFTIVALVVTITWIIRTCKHIYNYQYIANIEFKVYQKNKVDQIRNEDEEIMINEERSSQSTQYVPIISFRVSPLICCISHGIEMNHGFWSLCVCQWWW